MKLIIVLALGILAYAFTRVSNGGTPGWSLRINWTQKLLGAVAAIIALLIVINPEFLALGLLGDSAFVDLLVLLITLRRQTVIAQVRHCVATVISRIMRRVTPRMSFTLAVLAVTFGNVISAIQKVMHRISS